MTDEQPTDLTPLALDEERRAALAARILERGAPILARYGARTPVAVQADWVRPALAAAAVVAAVALGALLAGRTPSLEEVVISLEEAQP